MIFLTSTISQPLLLPTTTRVGFARSYCVLFKKPCNLRNGTESWNPYIDNTLSFNEYVTCLCVTGNRKLHALSRVSKYISLKTRHVLMRSFIISQFSFCSLIWMTYSKGLNNEANNIHERALRIVYKDFSPSFEGLLAKD